MVCVCLLIHVHNIVCDKEGHFISSYFVEHNMDPIVTQMDIPTVSFASLCVMMTINVA